MKHKRRKGSKWSRDKAAKLIRAIRKHPNWKIIPKSHREVMIKFAKGE